MRQKTRSSKKAQGEIVRISRFIRRNVAGASANGVVLGMSGGIDSAVVASLASRAIGPKHVTGVLMFEAESKSSQDLKDALDLISKLRINVLKFKIDNVVNAIREAVENAGLEASRIVLANIKARARMTLLYAVANARNLLVIGTGDRSEELIGYFTKYGDGGVDFMPIAHLYKTEVRELGRALGVPHRIVEKPSSPNLWRGHQAIDELPFDYPILDRVLELLFDRKKTEKQGANILGLSADSIKEVAKRYHLSQHKREYPPMLERRFRYVE